MTPQPPAPLFLKATPSAAHGLALAAAVVCFAIVSPSLLPVMAALLGGLAVRSLNPASRPLPRHALRFAFVFLPYCLALAPLWPLGFDAYYGLPLLGLLIVAALPAALSRSLDGGRGLATLAALAALLFSRNLVLLYDFEAPLGDLAYAASFVCLFEIARSNRYQNFGDTPKAEFCFGLLLATITSFSFDSLLLAVPLVALPLLAYLLRGHQTAGEPRRYSQRAQPRFDGQGVEATQRLSPILAFLLVGLPLLLAGAFYLGALRLPFWADSLPPRPAPLVESLALRSQLVAGAASLDTDAAQALSQRLLNPAPVLKSLEALASRIAPEPPPTETPDPTLAQQASRPTATPRDANRQRSDANPPPSPQTQPQPRIILPEFRSPFDRRPTETPAPRSGELPAELYGDAPQISELFQRSPLGLPTATSGASESAATPESSPSPDRIFQEPPPSAIPQPETEATRPDASQFTDTQQSPDSPSSFADPSPGFDAFLNAFDQPQRALGEALNLQNSNIPALLNPEPIATVKLDSARGRPDRLYLRSNSLDTLMNQGLGSLRSESGRTFVTLEPTGPTELDAFQQSERGPYTITLTARPRGFPTLPLPESFTAIETLDFSRLAVYRDDRVALVPTEQDTVTYRLYGVAFDVSDRHRHPQAPREAYRQRLLELPLDPEEKAYLAQLAQRVGGDSSPTRRFARRFQNYFARVHPYSLDVSIPPGPEHSAVRWLKTQQPGLCSNYAAAFTLLARSRGIPARVVTGYATEEYRADQQRYLVRQANAHAWVEYLDESNRWIRFDPTPRIDPEEAARYQTDLAPAQPERLQSLLQSESRKLAALDADTSLEDPIAQAPAEPAPPDPERPASPQPEIPEPQSSVANTFDAAAALDSLDPIDLQSLDTPSLTESSSPASEPESAPSEPASTPPVSATLAQAPQATTQPAPTAEPEPSSDRSPATPTLATSQPEPRDPPPNPSETLSGAASANTHEPAPPSHQRPLTLLLLLLLLALALPALALAKRARQSLARPPEAKVRVRAGQLLRQTERHIQQKALLADPAWGALRQGLAAQRYGPHPDPQAVSALAQKVAQLKSPRNSGRSKPPTPTLANKR